jgi:CheY-like chemotaxis protein
MRKTILIVEDTEDDVFFLKRALRDSRIDHPLSVVVDGQEALDYLQGKGQFADRAVYPLPFLILLDLKLPYVMGLDVLKWIRQQQAHDETLVAALTSSQQDRDMEETYRLGVDAYLIKPATRAKLLELKENLRDKWPKD